MNRARVLGGASAAGLIATLVVHVYTFWDESLPHSYPVFWLLHVGVFFVFGPAVVVVAFARQEERRLSALVGSFPASVIALILLVQVYAATVGAASFNAYGGVAQERPSGYALVNRGQFVRELTYAEYRHARALESRGLSSVWLVFYNVSMLFWLFRRENAA